MVITMHRLNIAEINLAAIIDGSDDAIIGENLNGIVTSWNQGAERIFGYTAQEAIGNSTEFLLPLDRLNEESLTLMRIAKGESVRLFETVRICKDGRRIDVSTTISPIIDSNGKVIGASKIARDITQQKEQAQILIEANNELLFQNKEKAKLEIVNAEKLYRSLMETIGIARQLVELRDPYTAGHEKHVGDLAKAIAAQMGFDINRQEGLMIAGYLHDIGKIIVPVEILCKPGKITVAEFDLIKGHVQAGYDLLKNVTFPWDISRSVLEHHERLDGSGYPNHLRADQISIEGRILAVADVVEAMSSYRPYRPALGLEVALAEIERGRGSVYDELVVDACLKLFREKKYKITTASLVKWKNQWG